MAFEIAPFSIDVTPRLGHPLLGNGFGKATGVDDPLYAKGFVFYGDEAPIVVVSIDWCELRNDAFAAWRSGLAQAAKTTPQRVLVSCVHQHDAPYYDLTAQRILGESSPGGLFCDPDFHARCVSRAAQAVAAAGDERQTVTQIGYGQAKVEQVASNRRVEINGKVTFRRYSRCTDAAMQAADDGTIDPWLKTVSFWNDTKAVVALHVYACHPMSYYGTGRISGDFVNAARDRRQADDGEVFQIYASGCSGDVTAGKYNDGATANRAALADRLYQAMLAAWSDTRSKPIERVQVRSVAMLLPHSESESMSEAKLRERLDDSKQSLHRRSDAALGLSNLARDPAGHRIDVQAIDFGPVQLALLPAESFVAYQLAAQKLRPDSFVATLGFGECAPGYIPTDAAFREGFREEHGYCWVRPGAEGIILEALGKALAKG